MYMYIDMYTDGAGGRARGVVVCQACFRRRRRGGGSGKIMVPPQGPVPQWRLLDAGRLHWLFQVKWRVMQSEILYDAIVEESDQRAVRERPGDVRASVSLLNTFLAHNRTSSYMKSQHKLSAGTTPIGVGRFWCWGITGSKSADAGARSWKDFVCACRTCIREPVGSCSQCLLPWRLRA